MSEVYILKCAYVMRNKSNQAERIEEVMTGVYSTYKAAKQDGEAFMENGSGVEAYKIENWKVNQNEFRAVNTVEKTSYIM